MDATQGFHISRGKIVPHQLEGPDKMDIEVASEGKGKTMCYSDYARHS